MDDFEVIEYSRLPLRSGVPPRRKGKFVRLTDGETDYMVLARYELATHHAMIVERFCMQNEVNGIWIRKPSEFRILARDWDILGGGHFVVDDEMLYARFFGESASYGGFDREELKERLATHKAFRIYAIRTE